MDSNLRYCSQSAKIDFLAIRLILIAFTVYFSGEEVHGADFIFLIKQAFAQSEYV